MTALSIYASGAYAFLRRDLALFLSYRVRSISIVLTMLFGLTFLHYIARLVQVPPFEATNEYFAFVVVGMVIMGVLTSTLATGPTSMRQELVAGTFERLLVSPFGAVAGIISMMAFPLVYGLVTGAVMLALSALLFGVDVTWATAPLALPAAVLGALSFLPFGLMIAAVVIAIKQAGALATFVVGGIAFVAGLYFPAAMLPGWIEWTTHVQPFSPAVDLLRHLLLGTELEQSAWVDVLKLIGFTLALLPLAIIALRTAIRFGRKRGTIAEY